jgi:predicted phosphodiesterase
MTPAAPTVFAVLGDVHGHLQAASTLIQGMIQRSGLTPEFILQVGDMEAHRNEADLLGMYAPHHLKKVGDFPDLLAGKIFFPAPVYFIGGNHEPYLYYQEQTPPRKLAPDFTYLGRAGQIVLSGLRISYLTGIYDEKYLLRSRPDYLTATDEPELAAQRFLSCITRADVDTLNAAARPDILLVHEWPFGIVRPEDHEPQEPAHRHLRYNQTGVQLIRDLCKSLRPKLLLCGHVHRAYRSAIHYPDGSRTAVCCLGLVDGQTESGAAFFTCVDGVLDEVAL